MVENLEEDNIRMILSITQNYWVLGLFPPSGILENRKHDVSETGPVSVLR
jgi:hypothetical protein